MKKQNVSDGWNNVCRKFWVRSINKNRTLLFLYEHQDKLLEVIEILENIHHLL